MTPPLHVRTALFTGVLLGIAASAGAAAPAGVADEPLSREARRAQFAIASPSNFQAEKAPAVEREGCTVQEVTLIAAPAGPGARVAGLLVRPRGQPVRAGALWVHWLGKPETSNRTEFLDEAVALARRGTVSVLVDAAWSDPGWYEHRPIDRDFDTSVRQVNALVRALGLLRAEAGDAVPLALVGHDYGGMYGAIAASVNGPLRTCVFIACTPSLLDWAFFHARPSSMEAYRHENRGLELRDYLADLGGAPVFCQFAERDRFVSPAKAAEFFSAVRGPKKMTVYGGANHEMAEPPAIRQDRTAWLVGQLGLPEKEP